MKTLKKIIRTAVPANVLEKPLRIYHFTRALLANIIFMWPARGQKIIMITGTNGKTTTAVLLGRILEQAGHSVGISSTVFYQIGDDTQMNDQQMTVSDTFHLQKLLQRMKRAQVDYVILETTSHSLDQYRALGTHPLVAAMTNLSQDHLDYHKTMERYAAAKAKLFAHKPPYIVLNKDDEWFDYYNAFAASKAKLTYGKAKDADCHIATGTETASGSNITLKLDTKKVTSNLQLAGSFNTYNAACAATIAYALGVSRADIGEGLQVVKAIPGRMEAITNNHGLNVIIDYAHTPDALKKTLMAIQDITSGRVIVVCGAAGDRPESWQAMGKVLAQHSDVAVIADDEPYSTSTDKIRDAILEGLKSATKQPKAVQEIADRQKAITYAIQQAKPEDTVFLAGIGHQQYRRIGDDKVAWSERSAAEKAFRSL